MELIRGLHNLRPRHRGCVATIGNFDGVHLGHQAVFDALRDKADTLGLPVTVVTFEPQPLEYFAPQRAPARLTRLREKCSVLSGLGIDRVLILPFGARLAALDAEDFVRRVLIDGLATGFLMVGDDFRFGHNRSGDFALLATIGRREGFSVENLPSRLHGGERISSTRVRSLLRSGDFAQAAELLGRPYRIAGRVARGDQRGHELGFPTINLALHRRRAPLAGVFAVRVGGLADTWLPGVANLGNRPTFDGDSRPRLEVHLFDFQRDVYGQRVEVEFVRHLRGEQRFDSMQELKAHIADDVAAARAVLLPVATKSAKETLKT